ncbi:hypothetical protein T09_6291 [Trichinella sp. T9]|nr:hypothetical protein T09_6291 [Trichinella sp. T9]
MRSERPTTGTESYELVEQADALQRLVNCLAVNDLDIVWWYFLLLPQDCSNDAEEYAFPYRLSKAVMKGSPLDGMVELLLVHKPLLWEFFARKCVKKRKDRKKSVRQNSGAAVVMRKMIFSFVQLLKEISSFAVWNDWRKLPPRQMVFKFESSSGEEHLHLPTATMAVSTVNYMQYDSSPDVWNFDDQEKELSDVQLMANHFCRVDEVHF